MLSGVKKTASACWKPVRRYVRMNIGNNSNHDRDGSDSGSAGEHPLFWSRDLERHFLGEFSFAVFQANEVLEDRSQVEIGRDATFIGVYDGHGGADAARYISDHLFFHLIKLVDDSRSMSEDVIRGALTATEDGFLTLVSRTFKFKPVIAGIGSCCLVGLIWKGTLYVANLGDSRAVIGTLGRTNKIVAEQLTTEHNASRSEIREELRSSHPDDSSILVQKQGVWRIKGIIQVSRSIGDAYLKSPELALDPTFPRFHFPEPISRPVLTAEPSVCTRALKPNDQFLIFASDGLWEHFTNDEAVQLVHNSPRVGIAKRLVQNTLKTVARKMKMKDEQLRDVEKGERRKYHDDITVVVIFLDHDLLNEEMSLPIAELSVQGFVDTCGPSKFNILQQATSRTC
ncbi:probable protein phosphatase 2C 25 [Spinacia oleracea]|uniref:protein-serine/threonine phosphatase n=1 Tax=Spinacia oleracea TaxID=3562 RepID=A0A9R0J4K8_SPIOL|nr:probable protein phosphatase 2C 25 [Spinacia oleracea]